MWSRKNKTRQTLVPVTINKPLKPWIEIRNWLFVSLIDGYIEPATSSTVIEWIAINNVTVSDNMQEPHPNERMCIYYPKRRWETYTIEVDNGEISQEDVGQTFLITGELQHINYTTKATTGWQFRLEQVITPTLWEFTYYFESSLSPQGPKGDDGETPTFTFNPVQTLPTGSQADLIVNKQWNNYELTFKIPAWANGARWPKWEDWQEWDDWDTIDLEIGTVVWWTTAQAQIHDVAPNMRALDLVLPKGEDGIDWLTPTPRGEWMPWTEYHYLDIVRYPDLNDIWSTWIWKNRNQAPTSQDVPGRSSDWMLLNQDGAEWPKGEEWGTIVVPVEWKPGKDGVPGDDGEPGIDGKSPHNEWDWDEYTAYTELAMVRASTGEYDPRWNEIFWYYITQWWVQAWDLPPKDNQYRQLMSKDWMAWYGNIYSAMVCTARDTQISWNYDSQWNGRPASWNRSNYTGNPDMVMRWGEWIVITRAWHYRIIWHAIIKNNDNTTKRINLWRMAIYLSSSRNWSVNGYWLGTAKSGWAYATVQGPWLDLTVDCYCDLYAWDTLTMYYRPQTDTDSSTGYAYNFTVCWALDETGDVQQWYLWWMFATYLWVDMVSRKLWQEQEWNKIIARI